MIRIRFDFIIYSFNDISLHANIHMLFFFVDYIWFRNSIEYS